jgi:hypothetical protein
MAKLLGAIGVSLPALILGATVFGEPVAWADGPSIHGGGTTAGFAKADRTSFALAISAGSGHFECLMPSLMNVHATGSGAQMTGVRSASFGGTATVTLPAGNPLGLRPGKIGPAPFTATASAGGPGVGQLDLKIMGMDFPGTVEHGQIQVGS